MKCLYILYFINMFLDKKTLVKLKLGKGNKILELISFRRERVSDLSNSKFCSF